MKAGGIVAIVVAGLLLAATVFFGIFSVKNSGAADRLERRLSSSRYGRAGSRFAFTIGYSIRRKARTQRNIAIGCGVFGVLCLAGGIVLLKLGKKKSKERQAEQQAAGFDPANAPKGMPGVIVAASIIWIIFGGLSLIGNLFTLAARGGRVGGIFGIAVAGAILGAGIQTISGKAKDTLGNSIAVLILSGLSLLGLLVLAGMTRGFALVFIPVPLALGVGGILGLVGRQRYLAYYAAKNGGGVQIPVPAAAPAMAGPLPPDNWYVGVGGQQIGPLTMDDVRGRVARGELTAENHIFHQQLGTWSPLSSVPGLLQPAAPAAPQPYTPPGQPMAQQPMAQQPMAQQPMAPQPGAPQAAPAPGAQAAPSFTGAPAPGASAPAAPSFTGAPAPAAPAAPSFTGAPAPGASVPGAPTPGVPTPGVPTPGSDGGTGQPGSGS